MIKFKLFMENILVYGLGGVISKIIPLIMIPIVTRLMPDTAYFGISDMSNTVVSFASAFAIMGMYDAMFRMFFEKDNEAFKKSICSTALVFTLLTSVIVFIILLYAKDLIASIFFGDTQYSYLVYITAIATLVGATNSIVAAPTRMQNKRIVFLIMNTVTPILSYTISIPLLLAGYYVVALPLAGMVAAISSELVFIFLNKQWFSLRKVDFILLKSLFIIGIPLLPNFLIYWIFDSSDKLMITSLIGIGATGIYSVGAKLGHASQLIYTAFAGGWQFFAFSTMKEENQVESNSRVFEYLGVISFTCAMYIFALAEPIYELLFTGDYVSGYIISPYLFLAPLLLMLYQVAGNQFLVIKKTWPSLFILAIGALVNIALNLWLIPEIGIEGAAIATLTGYIVSDIVAVIVLSKMKLMKINLKFICTASILVFFILIWRFLIKDSIIISLLFALFITVFYAVLYRHDLSVLLKQIFRKDK